MEDNQSVTRAKKFTPIFWVSVKFGVYSLTAFLTALAVIVPFTRIAVGLAIVCYLAYILMDTFKQYTAIELDRREYGKRAMIWAVSFNASEIVYLVISLLVGLLIGFGG